MRKLLHGSTKDKERSGFWVCINKSFVLGTFVLLERPMALHEERVCRASEENVQRRQDDDIFLAPIVLHIQDIHQLMGRPEEVPSRPQVASSSLERACPRPPDVKEEEEEVDVSQLPLNIVVVKSEDDEEHPSEWSRLGLRGPSGERRGDSPADKLARPPSHRREPLRSGADGGHCDDKRSKGSREEPPDAGRQTPEDHFTCSVCGKSFAKAYRNRHLRTHTREKTFRCSACGETFAQKVSLIVHKVTHTVENPFTCSVCGKVYYIKDHLSRHVRTHTGEKPFACSVCGEKFAHKISLVAHTATHTGEKPFACSVCGESFSYKHCVTRHMRTHTGEKPFACSVCAESFAYKETLNSHMQTHTGEKLFTCSVCGKNFCYKNGLKSHMLTHAGQKPFPCSLCGKSFAYKSTLKSHGRKHDGE
ncbi:zinc finger protein OZF-like [Hippocampus zosterae]|uniref:zinc finger protein OZF-like n=1 Tax=Hippocampus zosterae TaxID=109293 RepID=UPI00223D2546|nr:zinc finger protein OZF-like [Hippocampus zosterae]